MTQSIEQPERNDPAPGLPGALVSDLNALYDSDTRAPASLDDRVLPLARAYAAQRRRVRSIQTFLGASAGLAAGVALVAGVLWWLGPRPGPAHQPAPAYAALRANFSIDDEVSMLDAFALAVALRDDVAPEAQYDVNEDGSIDDRDVQQIAQHSVSLGPGEDG